ncbi:MAG: hypothetical protein WCP21_23665 [Armatimonadota bacterium]
MKAICYYSVDNIKNADANRNLNNYLLTDNERLVEAYRQAIAPDYFLSSEQAPGAPLPDYIERLADGQTLCGKVTLSAWAKALVITPVVEYRLDGRLLGSSGEPGVYSLQFDTASVSPGPHALSLTMLDRCGGRVLKQVCYKVNVGGMMAATPTPTPAAPVAVAAPPCSSPAPVRLATEDSKPQPKKKGIGASLDSPPAPQTGKAHKRPR